MKKHSNIRALAVATALAVSTLNFALIAGLSFHTSIASESDELENKERLKKIAKLIPSPYTEYVRLEQQEKGMHAWATNKTILSWLQPKYDRFFNNIKNYCLEEDPIYRPDSSRRNPDVVSSITNNANDNNFYGRTFFAFVDARLPFFKEMSSMNRKINVLIVADGLGRVGCLALYAFKNSASRVYINELSRPMVEKIKNRVQQTLPHDLKNSVTILPGDCRNILKNNPHLKESFDLIYCQHLEHFLNPTEHKEFLKLVNDALTIRGRAFLIAETLPTASWYNKTQDYLLYEDNCKRQKPYPGFIGYIAHMTGNDKGGAIIQVESAWEPKETEKCGYKNVGGKVNTFSVIQNRFTPYVYKQEIERIESLKFETSYYTNTNGVKATYETDGNITAVVAMAKKILPLNQIVHYWFLQEIFYINLYDKLFFYNELDPLIFLSLRRS